jgi:nucleoside-diphosphate-sugar epimerase
MRKLVIGCGYLGQRVAARWAAAGEEVLALTRSPQRAEEFRRRGWRAVVGDVMEPASLEKLPQVETLFYAVGFDRAAGLSQREVYVNGLRNVLEALAQRVGHWIYVSSTSVYGQQAGEWIDETSPTEPTRENGQVCREAELLIERHYPVGNKSRRANILRLAGLYGPGRLLRRVSDLKAGLPIQGDPDGWLNLIHVEDAVETILACENRGEPGAVYLVSDDEPVRRRDYYTVLSELLGVELPPFEADPGWHAQTNGMGVASGGTNQTTPFAKPQGVPPQRDVPPQRTYVEGLGKRCSNRKIREELGVTLRYPSIHQGLPQALAGELG